MGGIGRAVRTVRKELAALIAGRTPFTAQRIERELDRLAALGLTEEEQVQVIDTGARLYASGATSPGIVGVFARIAARGALVDDDVTRLADLGAPLRIRPETAVACWSEQQREYARRILGGA